MIASLLHKMSFRVYFYGIRIQDMPKAFVENYRKVDTPKANSYKVRVVRGVVSDHRAFFISYSKRIGVGAIKA